MSPKTGPAEDNAVGKEGNEKGVTKSNAPVCAMPLHPDVLAAQAKDVMYFLIGYRALNAIFLRTFFQPDEYFQSLEPAWQITFGDNSGAWLTWEWEHRLRSSLHPMLFATTYWIANNALDFLQGLPQFRAMILVAVPKIVQSLFAACGDFYTWRLAEKIYGQNSDTAWVALFMTVVNPWQWYCSTRTFSNSLETTLTIVALYHWPWDLLAPAGDLKDSRVKSRLSHALCLLFAALAVVLRPTNLLIWLAVSTLTFTRLTLDGKSPITFSVIATFVLEGILCGGLILGLSAVCDHFYFGEWTFPPYAWLNFNIAQSLAVFYGRNDWHYYVSQGLPLTCTTILPFVLTGLYQSFSHIPGRSAQQSNTLRTLSFAVISTCSVLSLIVHKEVRFIYPLLPILHILAAPYATAVFTKIEQPNPTKPPETSIKRKGILGILLTINFLVALYLGWFHGRSPIRVVNFLRTEFERLHPDSLQYPLPANHTENALELFALFLTPCHTTPWRSHLVYPLLKARALTCEPPLHTAPGSAAREAYRSETDRFYDDHFNFLSTELWPSTGDSEGIPRFIVGFQSIEDMLISYFGASGPGKDKGVKIEKIWTDDNGLFTDDDRKAGNISVWDTNIYYDHPI